MKKVNFIDQELINKEDEVAFNKTLQSSLTQNYHST